jgi:hypothetical protein
VLLHVIISMLLRTSYRNGGVFSRDVCAFFVAICSQNILFKGLSIAGVKLGQIDLDHHTDKTGEKVHKYNLAWHWVCACHHSYIGDRGRWISCS